VTTARDGTLAVPGATLFYRVRGDGPVLLVLQAGPGDADGSDALAALLADRYQVVAYDRRGLSRSRLDDPHQTMSIEVHAEDAHLLLAEVTVEPAYVFGSSLGALIGLVLVATHPDQVRLLVAHEAAVAQLLPEPDRSRLDEAQRDVDDTFRRDGPAKAIPKLFAISGVATGDDPEPGTETPQPSPESMTRHLTNFVFFLANDAPAAHRYQLDLDALAAVSAKIVPAAGAGSGGSFPHRSASALADRLDRKLVEMPGGHSGYLRRPRAFAAALDEILGTNMPAEATRGH
jgi:pimeloyl-ACP methyl ester carboxylesterase